MVLLVMQLLLGWDALGISTAIGRGEGEHG